MKRFMLLVVLTALTLFGLVRQVSAQTIPMVHGVQAFSAQAQFMSLSGFLRWQSFRENNVWISQREAQVLVKAQDQTTK